MCLCLSATSRIPAVTVRGWSVCRAAPVLSRVFTTCTGCLRWRSPTAVATSEVRFRSAVRIFCRLAIGDSITEVAVRVSVEGGPFFSGHHGATIHSRTFPVPMLFQSIFEDFQPRR